MQFFYGRIVYMGFYKKDIKYLVILEKLVFGSFGA